MIKNKYVRSPRILGGIFIMSVELNYISLTRGMDKKIFNGNESKQ